ncbi:RPM2 [Candida theae]|uniref:RPM2 n=1 Tax=Candida theae TaxID=1198502 RepID=A0AAD5BDF4_9ASCO|nr:RPM2 [Candida theae]KAI5954818.1 RPM2 [Candida theae]
MVLPSFIRLARLSTRLRQARVHHSNRRYRQPFFQASFPYLNTSYYYQGLSKRHEFFERARWWSKAETGSTSQSTPFLGIADGHYGLYYSMYNHECERKDRQEAYEEYTRRYMTNQWEQGDRTKYKRWIAAKFIISKAIVDTQVGLDNLKTATYRLATSCYVKPTGYFLNSGSNFHSTGVSSSSRLATSPINGDVFSIGISKRSFTTISGSQYQQLTKSFQTTPVTKHDQAEEPFESSFLQTQVANITEAFESRTDETKLNVIYPLYQAIKRNELTLPTVELYNIVLKSIIDRPVDNEADIGAIERKLTNLLTVYQDILYANLKPNQETYKLVVNAMLDSTIKCSSVSCSNYIEFKETSTKAKEFAQVAFELVESSPKHVQFSSVFDKIVTLSKLYPDLVSESIITSFKQLLSTLYSTDSKYYLNVLEFSAFLPQSKSYNEQEAYETISQTYSKIRDLNEVDEFAVYESMMTALVSNNQLGNASQLLDNILIDYKESLQFSTKPSKKQVSDLIAAFLKVYANKVGVVECYQLLQKFQQVAYLPELPVSFYNYMIVKLQEDPEGYDDMWSLYNRVALRKDFQQTSTIDMMKVVNGLSCRDALLKLAICKGDHERVFQLLKEIILKEHLIGDHQVFRMVLDYLNNGVTNSKSQGEFFNQYYLGLLYQVISAQAKHYHSSKHLNDFVSEFVKYLTISTPFELANNEMAVSSIANYNVQLLMSSPLAFKCVENFDLQSDNLYGLNIIARHLLLYSGTEEQTLVKVADLEAHLINQFEDAGNHYIQLTEDVMVLSAELKAHFAEIVGTLSTTTTAIEIACGFLNIPRVEATEVARPSFDQDLSYLLNVNYTKGATTFIDSFEKGFTFDFKTWNALINQNFINEYISRIDVASMLDRIWMTDCEEELKLSLLGRLVAYNDALVNQEILEFYCRENVFNSCSLSNLFQSSTHIDTVQFDFELAYSKNPDVNWVLSYFNYLSQQGRFDVLWKCCTLVDAKSEEIRLFALEAAYETDMHDFAKLLEECAVSRNNPKFIELQIKHAIRSGIVASDILANEYKSSSPNIIERLSYVKFLNSLQQSKFDYTNSKFVSLNHMASAILACGNFQQMKNMVDTNPIESKSQLVSIILQMMIDAVPHAPAKSILNRFMLFIKFYKVLGLGCVLPVQQFLQVITLLKLTKSDLLSILTNRVLGNADGGAISDIVNFYFLEVQLFDRESKQLVYNYLETN